MQRLASALSGYVNRARLRFIGAAVVAVSLVLAALLFLAADSHRTLFGIHLGMDYPAFYVAGKILNEYSADRLYDMELQRQLQHALHPDVPAQALLPYAYPPFFAVLFRPLAKLPYATSFFVWLLVSGGLYLAALAVISRTAGALPREAKTTALLLALSFEPFIMECWLGGQVSAFGLLWFALALRYERLDRPLAAGLALGVCWYKPTLLVLLIPMLVLARRFRTLGAMAGTGLGLGAVSLLGAGWASCRDYVPLLTGYVHSTVDGPLTFRTWKFVDLVSFFRGLGAEHPPAGWVLPLVIGLVLVWFVAAAWLRFDRLDREGCSLLWAATLTGTLVLNLYAGIYDSVLVVLTVWLTADCLCRRAGDLERALSPAFRLLLALVYVTPWFSQFLAQATGFQLYTLVLTALGAYQFRQLRHRAVAGPAAVCSGNRPALRV